MLKLDLVLIFLIASLTVSSTTSQSYTDYWVVWNVGQGQWVTHVLSDSCLHYDVGGEVQAFKILKPSFHGKCGTKLNKIFLSHWDLDHFNHIQSLARSVPKLCWQIRAEVDERTTSIMKVEQLSLPPCPMDFSDKPIQSWYPKIGQKKNDLSLVFKDQDVLIPGDSPIFQEKIWAQELHHLSTVRVLILGHHGSRTSTGADLLKRLPGLKVAVVSARSRRYGHPHKTLTDRLLKNKTPILKTEDWGSIIFL